jgi:hypothetical protein
MDILSRIFKISDFVSIRHEGGKYLLFDNINGNIFRLNELSFEILSLCDGKNSEERILCLIHERFDASGEKISCDFNALVNMLLDKKYISII